jgi:uncharacterized Zn finger protein
VRRDRSLFTEADLLRLAGPARFERGRSLVDMVDDEYEDEYSLCATVTDGRPYLAMVHHRVGRLAGECDCPDGRPGSFCEHSVALGLSYLDDDGAPGG